LLIAGPLDRTIIQHNANLGRGSGNRLPHFHMEKYIRIKINSDNKNLRLSYSEFDILVEQIRNAVPDQYKDVACIDIRGTNEGYDMIGLEIYIYYTREETAEEATERLNKKRAALIKKENEELETFRRLLAKYTTQT